MSVTTPSLNTPPAKQPQPGISSLHQTGTSQLGPVAPSPGPGRAPGGERGIALWISPEDAATLKADAAARDEILIEMQIKALKTFRRKALIEKEWDPNCGGPRGASCLMTYYIHTCIWEFGRVFKKWAQERVRWHELHALSDFGEETPGGRRGIAGLLQASRYLAEPEAFVTIFEEILDERKRETQAVIRLTIDGYPDTEIADKLKITNAAVRMRKSRFREVIYQVARERRIAAGSWPLLRSGTRSGSRRRIRRAVDDPLSEPR
ncbi:hypothetical protein [Streptomyces sp. NPDC088141]|uniref:hypothetical protein n=1 Tax=unclassified Streptomyces TaxID=2593676 RepID=UPI003442B975